MVVGNRQRFGEDPVQVRETDHYKLEYIQSFVEKWDELIDWEQRSVSEGNFFIQQLRERGLRLLDVVLRSGAHAPRTRGREPIPGES